MPAQQILTPDLDYVSSDDESESVNNEYEQRAADQDNHVNVMEP